ncbi:Unknown protein sequence [Pseudomonas amygdali pv. myricae]|nr:Unknown protein sequence [Pseudomonas amygdali pv. myricae]
MQACVAVISSLVSVDGIHVQQIAHPLKAQRFGQALAIENKRLSKP